MIKDRKELETELSTVLENIQHSRKKVQEVNEKLREYDIYDDTFNNIVSGNIKFKLENLDWRLLCLVTDVLEETKNSPIFAHEYFTRLEIERSKNYIADTKIEQYFKLPYTIPDVIEIDSQNYITKIKMVDLIKLYFSGLIDYDFESQRSPVFKGSKESPFQVPEVNKKSVKSISTHMNQGTFLIDTITLNVDSDDVDPIYYNSKTKELTVNEGAVITILDGFHRLQGGIMAYRLNNDLDLVMQLAIKQFDKDQQKKYFGQINTQNPVSQERLRALKESKLSETVVKNLMLKSELKGKVSTNPHIDEIAGHLTTFSTLADVIDELFTIESNLQAREVSTYLGEFFDYLLGSFPDVFIKRPEYYRQNSYITNPNIFIGYVALAKRFQELGIKLSQVREVIESINFDKANTELSEILDAVKRSNSKRAKSKIIKYFNEIELTKIGGVSHV
jgi:hypothetical protein